MKLDRIHQIKSIQLQGQANPALSLEYSANAQEWTPASQLTDRSVVSHLVRYVRLVNKTNQEQAVTATSLLVTTKEVQPTKLESTSMGIHPAYGSNDVRKLNNLDQLFDGVYNNFVEFSDYARKDGHVTLKLGSERTIKKIRAYIQDGTQNYLRDGKIQVSQDGKTWTDVVTVGDGVANSTHDDSLTDGWTHDSKMPGNRYIEGELTTPVKANYLRVLYTADYDARFVGFTELVINDGEFVKPINDPTVEGSSGESQGNLYNNLVDGKVLTSYKSEKTRANWCITYLSQPMLTTFVSFPVFLKERKHVFLLEHSRMVKTVGQTSVPLHPVSKLLLSEMVALFLMSNYELAMKRHETTDDHKRIEPTVCMTAPNLRNKL